jgi:hypothetical protein
MDYLCDMQIKRFISLVLIFGIVFLLFSMSSEAQCSICTRTAQQLGEKPAKGLNAGILYLAFTPLILIGFITYKWWKKNSNA